MNILTLDTALQRCSVALYDAGQKRVLAAQREDMTRGHAEALAPMVQAVLEKAGVRAKEIARIGVTRGPGTFTGLRIGLSLARGMGLALEVPVIGIDTLTASWAPYREQPRVAVIHEAGATGLFYCGFFAGSKMEPLLLSRDVIVSRLAGARWLLVGTGSAKILEVALQCQRATGDHLPDAATFADLLSDFPPADAPPAPLYLREHDAKPSTTLTILGHADVAAMAALHGQCFAQAWGAESFATSLQLPGGGALGLVAQDQLIGFLQYLVAAGEAEIVTVAVDPLLRRQGHGRRLLEGAVDLFRTQTCSAIHLEVDASNLAALTFYRASGFEQVGLRKNYYSNRDGTKGDAIRMVRRLK